MFEIQQALIIFWPHLLAVLGLILSLAASVHVLLKKEEAVAALAWMGMIWFVPIVGSALYWAFGINRVKRRARLLRPAGSGLLEQNALWSVEDRDFLQADQWRGLKQVLDHLTGRPLQPGNSVELLIDGTQAYPEMLRAIAAARRSVALATYIFGNDPWGQAFVDALKAAKERGVEVRVLLDGVGRFYSWPSIVPRLRQAGIRYALFLHSLLPWRMPYLNLRNHRKLLIIDGELGFTGGLNLRAHHVGHPPRAHDLHFRIQGPVVAQMMQVFQEDWLYTHSERLQGEAWMPALSIHGRALARGIADGPDEDYDRFRWSLLAALGQAQQSVMIMTPYFLPDMSLVTALQHAAMRGVRVEIVLPAKNNWPFMRWAGQAKLAPLLAAGCTVYYRPPPFDHSKIMLVDGAWVLLGSGNWDPRSFRMNFEFNLEVYDGQLASRIEQHVVSLMKNSQQLELKTFKSRPLWQRLRDGLAHLFSPYL